MTSQRHIWQIAGACALAATVAACGGSSPSPSTSPSSSAPTSATITANWKKFFNGKTPVSERVSLLEDGSQFPKATLEPTAMGGLAAQATATVLSVTNITASSATVKYNVLLAGSPALKNQVGTAVYEDGTWRVGVSSFCGLLKLEISSKDLPPVCKTAS
jgi:hypothetical protein